MTPEAVRFGTALRHAVARRSASLTSVAEATGVSLAAVSGVARGQHLPSVAHAKKMADALDSPLLYDLIVSLRTRTCLLKGCGRTYLAYGARSRYCSPVCRAIAGKGGRVLRGPSPERAAIEAMCRDCEPGGSCRQEDCPLRAFSPLPLVILNDVPLAAKRRRYHPDPEVVRAKSTARWKDPAYRDLVSRRVRETLAAQTPEQRAHHATNISKAKRRAVA